MCHQSMPDHPALDLSLCMMQINTPSILFSSTGWKLCFFTSVVKAVGKDQVAVFIGAHVNRSTVDAGVAIQVLSGADKGIVP